MPFLMVARTECQNLVIMYGDGTSCQILILEERHWEAAVLVPNHNSSS